MGAPAAAKTAQQVQYLGLYETSVAATGLSRTTTRADGKPRASPTLALAAERLRGRRRAISAARRGPGPDFGIDLLPGRSGEAALGDGADGKLLVERGIGSETI
jgi:hypothetical protein